jgi:hypothetical protein
VVRGGDSGEGGCCLVGWQINGGSGGGPPIELGFRGLGRWRRGNSGELLRAIEVVGGWSEDRQ